MYHLGLLGREGHALRLVPLAEVVAPGVGSRHARVCCVGVCVYVGVWVCVGGGASIPSGAGTQVQAPHVI